jgi:hypothetical protein
MRIKLNAISKTKKLSLLRVSSSLNAKTGRVKLNKANPADSGKIFDNSFDETFE